MGSGLAFKHSGSVVGAMSLTELTEFTENDLVMPFPSALLRINGRLPLMITTRSLLSLETQRTRRTED